MPKLACKIPERVALACSGGADSMSALSFLLKGKREVVLLHFNHGTKGSDIAEDFVLRTAEQSKLECVVGRPEKSLPANEASWREGRYKFFSESNYPVVMAHHLNDAAEWWIFSSLRGNPSLMPIKRYHNGVEILRPFIFFSRDKLVNHNYLGNVEDPSNKNLKHSRNRIRNKIVPEALKVNPGLLKTVSNLYSRS